MRLLSAHNRLLNMCTEHSSRPCSPRLLAGGFETLNRLSKK